MIHDSSSPTRSASMPDQAPATAEGVRAGVEAALALCRSNRDALVASGAAPIAARAEADARTLDYDRLTLPLDRIAGWVRVYARAHPDADLRAVCEEAEREIQAFGTELSLDPDLFKVVEGLEAYFTGAGSGGDAQAEAEQRRLIANAARDFRRAGVDRTPEERAELARLRAELVEVGQRFSRNIIEGGRELRVAGGHAALAGCPQDLLDANPEQADGSVLLSTDPATRLPLMTYAADRELRRDYHRACQQRAHPENVPELERMLALRHELASRLGYATWAEYATADKMSGSPAAVAEFLADIGQRVQPRAVQEAAEMLALLREEVPDADVVREYDRVYLTDRLRHARAGLDSRALREYFEYGRVRDGVLEVASKLFDVEFAPGPADLWHESVESFELRRGGRVLGLLYLDMHPRPGKFKHACLMGIASGVAGEQLPEGVLLCNFPEPGADGAPALLSHDQVTTLFHEFGHLMHHLLSAEHRYLGHAGIAVEWDFVEVPSQLMEEWAWDPGVLAGFAVHAQTGERLGPELAERMARADAIGRATHIAMQWVYATYSLELYDRSPEGVDPFALMNAVRTRCSPFPTEEQTYMPASFGHLNSYTALYYTYLWSLSISKDFFGRFAGDPFGERARIEYRERVLERGGAEDAAQLVAAFLGRPHSAKAFEDWLVGA